jgi:hypothetical protein
LSIVTAFAGPPITAESRREVKKLLREIQINRYGLVAVLWIFITEIAKNKLHATDPTLILAIDMFALGSALAIATLAAARFTRSFRTSWSYTAYRMILVPACVVELIANFATDIESVWSILQPLINS